jgi:ataxia telangiectasia mutated family protein
MQVGHLLGLGDRHLDNILLQRSAAQVVHIDFSVIFDR